MNDSIEREQSSIEREQSRREVLRSSLRYLALGGIWVVSAALIAREPAMPGQRRCRRPFSCRDCAALAECKLPRAAVAGNRRKG